MWQIWAPECSRPEAARQETDAVQKALSYHTDMADKRLTDEHLRFFDTFGFLAFLALRIFAFPLSDGRISRKERLEEYKERRRS